MQPIFNFDDACVNLWSDDYTTCRNIDTHKESDATNHPHYEYLTENIIPIKGTGWEEVVTYDEPKLTTIDYWLKRYPDFEGVRLMNEVGFKEYLVLPLWEGEKKLGVLEFHSKEARKLAKQSMELF